MTEHSSSSALTLQFLAWLAERPRTCGETMEPWHTSCPRFSIWEDAVCDRLVEVRSNPGTRQSGSLVALTDAGRAVLDGAA
jgi:hypothetical protein